MIPVSEPKLGREEITNLLDTIARNWLSNGYYVERFEEAVADFTKKKYAVACMNATCGMHLALSALGVNERTRVGIPAFTMIATALPAYYLRAKMVFIDADPQTWCLDARVIPDNCDVIMPVHIYGHPVEPLSLPGDVKVVEDAAEAMGAEPIGWGDMTVYSFYANKMITSGEGGMITTDSKVLADKCRRLRNMAFGNVHKFIHEDIGYNYRMTDMQGAVGLAQLGRIREHIDKKRQIADWYNERLEDTALHLPVEREWAFNVYWMYGIILPERVNRDKFMFNLLHMHDVETREFFYPLHKQPCFARLVDKGTSLPVSEWLGEQGLYLPSGLTLTEADADKVCEGVRKCLKSMRTTTTSSTKTRTIRKSASSSMTGRVSPKVS